MISVIFYQNQKDFTWGFQSSGHADYAKDQNDDIICAAVSSLCINTANSLELLLGLDVNSSSSDGYLEVTCSALKQEESAMAQLLFDSLYLGIESIENQYGSQYVTVSSIQKD